MTRLNDESASAGLSDLPGWSLTGDDAADGHRRGIEKIFELPDFPAAIAFVVRVGFLAEAADHHPDLDVRWRTVRVFLTTHDAGGLTGKDLALAGEIEGVA
ncbi:MAG: 4a-hydroxytetrahydrobiopterin dehydratase [Acidimicrobiia bacterium]